ncbi:Acyl-CoA dehydrogenase domain-containing protein [Paraburkholderia piptadeniae]|uniref:Acyl-CoA dehydrogenase domain-containing protein n=1 Tax=Paraburkholderia piptadeniae TaxID=1701573 RepID=A0A1N7SE62_9BURK|nr:acyl-CoA dehydrogenase [Paraburkholderia piptadeniae]SIT45663.1 Acyl-CoA dehydrogenase domain-containing protein [Paraburkholderia piptadeniae]
MSATFFVPQVSSQEDLDAIRDSARSLLSAIGGPARMRARRRLEGGLDRDAWRQAVDIGWLAILTPEELGGLGLGLQHAAVVAEEVGRHLWTEPLTAAGFLPVLALRTLSVQTRCRDLLEKILSGECLAGLAWQENDGDVGSPAVHTLRAETSSDAVVLNGNKRWVTPTQGVDGWLVWADSKQGKVVVWVPADTPGIEVCTQRRPDGSSMGTITLSGVSLPLSNVLATGDLTRQALDQALECACLLQASELLGVARQLYDITREYLTTRVQFGRPIGANQALQHRMVDAYIQIELTAASLEECLVGAQADASRLALLASRAKARAARTARELARLAIQFHGAMGYTDECDVGLYFKRAIHLSTWLGNAKAHMRRHHQLLRQAVQVSAESDAPEWKGNDYPRDADWGAMSDGEFRAMLRSFFREHYPESLRHVSRRVRWHETREWYMTLSRQGWLAPSWPRQHGGMGLPAEKLLAYIEEQEEYGIARMPDQGLINLGPLLIRFGTRGQQTEWLPKIISGEHIWCQGYSEPNAGSDLASLRTEARLDGDDYIVNGQKIWTTLAHDATHSFLLVRTSKLARKQEGISFLLVDLRSPGVTIRPIRNIADDEEFCEVFFDNVRVPRSNLLGQPDEGWAIAKALLGFERLFVGSPKTVQYALSQLRSVAQARNLFADAAFNDEYAALELDLADLKSLYTKFSEFVKRGDSLPSSVSILKIWATETYARIGEKLIEAADEYGGTFDDQTIAGLRTNPAAPLLNALVTTIYGGTNEIQRNILARNVLELPQ